MEMKKALTNLKKIYSTNLEKKKKILKLYLALNLISKILLCYNSRAFLVFFKKKHLSNLYRV